MYMYMCVCPILSHDSTIFDPYLALPPFMENPHLDMVWDEKNGYIILINN